MVWGGGMGGDGVVDLMVLHCRPPLYHIFTPQSLPPTVNLQLLLADQLGLRVRVQVSG